MKSAILFQSFNRLQFTKKCLETYLSNTSCPHKLVIIDNGSTDGTRQYLEELEASKRVYADFYYMEKNYGRDRPRSFFLDRYRHDYEYLGHVVNDVLVSPGWLPAFEKLLDAVPEIGILGPVDRDWGNRDLVERNAVKFYGGIHFHWSDAYWLMRSSVISAIQKQILNLDGQTCQHPGYFILNSMADTQGDYWKAIRQAGYLTACHPDHWMKFVWKEYKTSEEWHKKYTILIKVVHCKNPKKYSDETDGTMRYRLRGKTHTYANEHRLVRRAPDFMLAQKTSDTLAQLDDGVTPDDLKLLSQDEWNTLTYEDIF